jgi:hypothetical protein
VWATATRQIRIVYQITWFPQRPLPRVNSQDLYRAKLLDLINILTTPTTDTFVGTLEQTQRAQLLELMDVMYRTNDTPQPDDAATSPAPSLGVAPRSPVNPETKVAAGHAIFSGTAINNDTGKPAEYKELSQSSDGPRMDNRHE